MNMYGHVCERVSEESNLQKYNITECVGEPRLVNNFVLKHIRRKTKAIT